MRSQPLMLRGEACLDPYSAAALIIGGILVFIGGVFDLVASIGINKFPDFYTRLHAVTIGAIGGAVYPILGSAIMALGLLHLSAYTKLTYILPMLLTAVLILITAPTGSHAVARAAYRSGLKPKTEENR